MGSELLRLNIGDLIAVDGTLYVLLNIKKEYKIISDLQLPSVVAWVLRCNDNNISEFTLRDEYRHPVVSVLCRYNDCN